MSPQTAEECLDPLCTEPQLSTGSKLIIYQGQCTLCKVMMNQHGLAGNINPLDGFKLGKDLC